MKDNLLFTTKIGFFQQNIKIIFYMLFLWSFYGNPIKDSDK